MGNRRFKDLDWDLAEKDTGNIGTWEKVQIAVLMDIRDELRIISRKLSPLECSNFLAIPHTLKRISRNTAKPRKPKAARKPKLTVVR